MINTQFEANKRYINYFDDLKIVKDCFLGDWSFKPDINFQDCFVLREAIKRNDQKMIKFLLLNKKIKQKVNINYGKVALLKLAFIYSPISLINFLLTDEQLPEKIDIFSDGNRILEAGLDSERKEVIQFLLSDKMLPYYENKYSIEENITIKLLEKNNFDILEWLWETQHDKFHYRAIDFFYDIKNWHVINSTNSLWLAQYFCQHDSPQFIELFELNLLNYKMKNAQFLDQDRYHLAIEYMKTYALQKTFQNKLKSKPHIQQKKTKI
jgi:hypothetical protein